MRARTSVQFARLIVLLALLSLSPFSDRAATVATPDDDASAAATQVRLRKLHLVRPDLIPYPISFEVYC
jgi:hypothetical protein